MKSATTLRLGDTVSGEYHGVSLTGVITSFDACGYVYVRPTAAIVVHGIERPTNEELAFDRYARRDLKVIKRGPELTWDDVIQHPYDCLGGQSLKVMP